MDQTIKYYLDNHKGGDINETIKNIGRDLKAGKYNEKIVITSLLLYILYERFKKKPEPKHDIQINTDLPGLEETHKLKKECKTKDSHLESLKLNNEDLKKKLAAANAEHEQKLAELRQQLATANVEREQLQRANAEHEQKLAELRQQLATVNVEHEQLQRANAEHEQKLAELRQQLATAEREQLQRANAEREQLQRANAEHKQKLAELRQQLATANVEHEQKLAELRQKLATANVENTNLRQQLEQDRKEREQLNNSNLDLIQEIKLTKTENEQLLTDILQYENAVREKNKINDELKIKFQDLEKRIASATDKLLENAEKKYGEMKTKNDVLNRRIEQLEKANRELVAEKAKSEDRKLKSNFDEDKINIIFYKIKGKLGPLNENIDDGDIINYIDRGLDIILDKYSKFMTDNKKLIKKNGEFVGENHDLKEQNDRLISENQLLEGKLESTRKRLEASKKSSNRETSVLDEYETEKKELENEIKSSKKECTEIRNSINAEKEKLQKYEQKNKLHEKLQQFIENEKNDKSIAFVVQLLRMEDSGRQTVVERIIPSHAEGGNIQFNFEYLIIVAIIILLLFILIITLRDYHRSKNPENIGIKDNPVI